MTATESTRKLTVTESVTKKITAIESVRKMTVTESARGVPRQVFCIFQPQPEGGRFPPTEELPKYIFIYIILYIYLHPTLYSIAYHYLQAHFDLCIGALLPTFSTKPAAGLVSR